MSSSTFKPLTATCLCTSIQLKLTAPPQSSYLCHCLDCRKVTGSLFAPQITFARSAVEFVRGYELLGKYSGPVDEKVPATTTDSGEETEVKEPFAPFQSWCSKCGSPVMNDEGDNIKVKLGLIDVDDDDDVLQRLVNGGMMSTEDGEEAKSEVSKFRPRMEFFCKRKAEWAKGWQVEGAVQRLELMK